MEFVAINKLSLLDYPEKVSCILYTQGCNFRCPFCHNGLTLLGQVDGYIPFEEILTFLKKRQGILDAVVISGGEPTFMRDLKEKLISIKNLGFAIKLDTNGSNPDVMLDLINSGLIDYVAMDIKNSVAKYELTSGAKVPMDNILRSIEILKSGIVDYEFRTTLVKEFHTGVDIISMGKLLKGAKRLYLQQYKLSDGVIDKSLSSINEEEANKFVEILKEYVEVVELRGY